MDREKQIEEIAKVLCGGCSDNKECMHCLCADWYRAEALYNAGYRKQSEVVRCKDCQHLLQDLSCRTYHTCMRFRLPQRVNLDDFCSFGERKYTDESGNDR